MDSLSRGVSNYVNITIVLTVPYEVMISGMGDSYMVKLIQLEEVFHCLRAGFIFRVTICIPTEKYQRISMFCIDLLNAVF